MVLIFLMSGLFTTGVRAQDSTSVKTVLNLEYVNKDGIKILTAKLSARKKVNMPLWKG